jgi:Pro-kumamolisin, activation domain
VSPRAQDVARVFAWLKSLSSRVSFGETQLELVRSRDFIRVHGMPLTYVEQLLRVTMQRYTHLPTGVVLYRTPDDYLLPDEIAPLIDFVSSMHRLPPLRGHAEAQAMPVNLGTQARAGGTQFHIARIFPGDGEYELVFAPLQSGAPCTTAPCFQEAELHEQYQNSKRVLTTTMNEHEDDADLSVHSAYCKPCSEFDEVGPFV